jgi:NAD+ synthase (glutamine-hydrolysing)
VSICEDAWSGVTAIPHGHAYPTDPVSELAKKGATIFINLSASPFEVGKLSARMDLVGAHAKKHGIPFAYCDQVGGNDELVFDGTSFFMDASGRPIGVLPSFAESVAVFDSGARGAASPAPEPDAASSICNALVLGVRDYLRKTGFSKAVVGLSGGIDSAVVCAIAAEALGSENVMGISMPSPYSSGGSIEDSRLLAKNLGVKFLVIPITEVFKAYLDVLEPQFTGMRPDTTEENIQARIRGNYLMAFSNKYGSIVLSTGNKSELAVGYCTLYGDMSGGLAVIADVPKTMVYGVAAHINRDREIIPVATIRKAPSAELKPDQKDQDTLPPYEILDAILERYLEDGLSVRELEAEGFDPKTVAWVVGTVNRNEYKRRQAAPGLKVTSKAFGVGRRIPIAARYRP